MLVLAVDSSGLTASVAVVTENVVMAEYTVNYKKTHSQTLLPMIDTLVKMLELKLETIDALAVTKGPGSFTGLRIGTATIKGLGLALNKPIIGVPTVDAIAYNLYRTDAVICPMMDAKRNEVYTGIYAFDNDRFITIKEQEPSSVKDIISLVNQYRREVVFLGDGSDAYKSMIQEMIQVPYTFAPPHLSRQKAGSVGMLAIQSLIEGKEVSNNNLNYIVSDMPTAVDIPEIKSSTNYLTVPKMETAAEFKPVYLRLSQAERELREKVISIDNTIIRDMEKKDISSIVKLEQQVFGDPWKEDSFIYALNSISDIYLVAACSETILGYCGLKSIAGEGHIMNICVHPDYQERGIGKRLVEALIQRGREAGNEAFTLEVRKNNQRALALYKKFGFNEIGIRKEYYNSPKDDAIIMWLLIKPKSK